MPHPRRRARTLLPLAALAAVPLTGCTAFSAGYVPTVVVTVTPTVTVTPKAAPSASPSASTTPTPAKTDIVSQELGNNHDLGRITAVKDDGGTKVISFDRYRKSGVRTATILRDGIELVPHRTEYFINSATQLYTAPVRPDATFVKQTCVTRDQPATTAPSSLEELAGLKGREGIVLLDLDDKGWVTKAVSDPVCQ